MPEIVKINRRRVQWVMVSFLTFDQAYRDARRGSKYEGFACFKCGRAFECGDRMGLVGFERGPNRVACWTCAKALEREFAQAARAEGAV